MKKKAILAVLLTAAAVVLTLSGCDGLFENITSIINGGSSTDGSTDSTTVDTTATVNRAVYAYTAASESSATYDAEDIYEDTVFAVTAVINFDEMTCTVTDATVTDAAGDGGTAQTITADGVLVYTDTTASGTTAAGTITVSTSGGLTITSTVDVLVKYELTGTLDGTFSIISAKKYALVLDGADITSSDGPALYMNSTKRAFIVLASGSENTLTDTRDPAAAAEPSNTKKGAIYTKGQVVFAADDYSSTAQGAGSIGTGTLTVNASYKNGIYSDDYIRFRGGTYTVNVSDRDGIRTLNAFIFDDGNLTITGTGSAIDDESKGIKVDGDDSEDGAGLGYIVINGGTITINTISKGITASWDIDEDTTDYTDGNPDPYVEINNGIITITTTGEPYEETATVDGVSTTVSLSPEGIEGKKTLIINSGYIILNCTDDCLNVSCKTAQGGSLTINGGCIYAHSSNNDSIDSNGTLTINGGIIVALGTVSPECAFDCDQNTLSINGGTLIGLGTSNYSTPTASACTQNTFIIAGSYLTSGSVMAVTDTSGNAVFAYTMPSSCDVVIVSSPLFTSGTSYKLYKAGTVTSDDTFCGMYLGSLNYTAGTLAASFTESSSSTITSVGSVTSGGAAEGTRPGPTGW